MKKIAVAVIVVSAIQGCSSGPSDADAKQAIAAKFANCQGLAVESAKIINGLDVNDGVKQILVHYTVKVIPVDPSEIADYKQAKKDADEADQQLSQIYQDAANAGLNSTYYYKKYQEFLRERGEEALLKKSHATWNMKKALTIWDGGVGNGIACLQAVGYKADPGIYGGTAIDIDALLENGGESQMEVEITMIKTDNGWMEAAD
ncbi:hypothetical protein [Solimonas flava]|uniref:hypothetical protein n=1 Tax=Solimonas flava TaxID=415849 RepID=UPI0004205AFA|nr:hypothetical protein [Solimonas flava]